MSTVLCQYYYLLLKMKKLLALSFLSLALLFVSCKKDDEPGEGTVTLRVNFTAQGQPIDMNQTFPYNGNDHQVTLIKMYLSQLELVCNCGDRKSLSEVILVDSDNEATSFEFKVPAGNYDAISMWLGLPEELNEQDPATFDAENPLSAQQNMYWTWASRYRFLIYEGRVDSTQSNNFDHLLVYHTGTDTLYRELQSFPLDLSVSDGSQHSIDIYFDLQKVLYNPSDPIDIFVDDATHTMDNMELARRITENAVASFSIE